MATFVASLLISLDGRNANEASAPDPEEHEEFNRLFDESDHILFDRADYELLVPYWDDVYLDDPAVSETERGFARIFRTKPRIVIAPDLEQVDPLSELIRADPLPRLQALKRETGGRVLVSAGAGLLTILLAHNMVNEVHAVVRPYLLGGGGDSPTSSLLRRTNLALLESRSLASGTLVVRYRVLETPD